MPERVRSATAVVRTPDGWTLQLRRALRGGRAAAGPPVLLVHGYGMNASIFGFHPRGPSFLEHLYEAGLDPWTVDLRGTSTSIGPSQTPVGPSRAASGPSRAAPDPSQTPVGPSRAASGPSRAASGPSRAVTLEEQAHIDLPAVLGHIAAATGSERVHAIGCSLGGALLYAHVGRDADHRVDRLVTMGSPLVWQDLSLPLRVFKRLGHVLGAVPLRGTRSAARAALPILARVAPDLLAFYLNPRLTFTGPAGALAATVEDPQPHINQALAAWMNTGHLTLDGHDVTAGLASFARPLMVVLAEGDGVVPPAASAAAATATAGPTRLLRVTHPEHRVSHVDLFIGDHVHDAVYAPVAAWLTAPQPA
jgi:pimeloyl-ACP methyl ester carboxylesterase